MSIRPAPVSLPAVRRANKAELAEFFGVSLPSIEGWIRRGCPVLQRGSRGVPWVFDLLEVAGWRLVGTATTEDGDTDPDKLQPADRDRWYASEIKRLDYEKQIQHLMVAEDVRGEWAGALKSIMLSLETLTDVIERDAGLSPEQTRIVQRVIDEQRGTLYEQMADGGE